jgi:hypothetical protein
MEILALNSEQEERIRKVQKDVSSFINEELENLNIDLTSAKDSYDAASAIKITIPRPATSGDIDDTDVFGGQQYGPLVDLEVP